MSPVTRLVEVTGVLSGMGEHLKGKLQGMIRQRFENYLHIIKLRPQFLSREMQLAKERNREREREM